MINGTIAMDMDKDAYYTAGGLQICPNSQWATVCQQNWNEIVPLWLVDKWDLPLVVRIVLASSS